jgi:class 3 adenylate cyclase
MSNTGGLFEAVRAALDAPGGLPAAADDLWERFGVNRAVLILDSTGFTRVTRSRGVLAYLGLLVRMREALLPLMADHGALQARAHADNLYAEFESVPAALAAATACHETVAELDLRLNDREPYRVCIGIGWGRVLRAGEEIAHGDEMNLASKLGEDVAKGGETLLTEAAWAALPAGARPAATTRAVCVGGADIPYRVVNPAD